MTQETKAPIWFWIVGIFAFLWNGLGVGAYANDIMMTSEDFAKLTKVEQELFAKRPFWATAAFAIAVIAGFLGSVMLLLRKPIAVRLFLLSLIAVLVQFSSYFILDGYAEHISQTGWWMPISIPIFAAGFLLFAGWAENNRLLQ